MDRETLIAAHRRGPVRVTMNDGSQYVLRNNEETLVSDLSVHSLYKDEDSGQWRTHILSLVCVVRIEELAAAQ